MLNPEPVDDPRTLEERQHIQAHVRVCHTLVGTMIVSGHMRRSQEKHRTAMLAAEGTEHEQAIFQLFEVRRLTNLPALCCGLQSSVALVWRQRVEEVQKELDGLRKIYEVCQRDEFPVDPKVMEEVYLYLKEFVHNKCVLMHQ
jgi:hypothetical protein